MSKKHGSQKSTKTTNRENEKTKSGALPGWPGYRTRDGRSGYDPIDSRTESAHMLGYFIRHFFTVSIKTKNPVVLFLLCIFGVFFEFPLIFAIVEAINGYPPNWVTWSWVGITGILGLLALANCIKNMIRLSE